MARYGTEHKEATRQRIVEELCLQSAELRALDEIGRSEEITRQAYTAGVRTILDQVAFRLAPDDRGAAHGRAVNVFSLIVGTLQLSRARGRRTDPDGTTHVHHHKEIR